MNGEAKIKNRVRYRNGKGDKRGNVVRIKNVKIILKIRAQFYLVSNAPYNIAWTRHGRDVSTVLSVFLQLHFCLKKP